MTSLLAQVGASDLRLCGRVRAWTPPPWVRVWMLTSTRLGDGWGWLAVGALLLCGDDTNRAAAGAATASAAVASGGFAALKEVIRRPRPSALGTHPAFTVVAPDRWSFPSGHTMNAFAIGSVLALQFPEWGLLLLFASGSIGASRVVLGLHYPSDVVAGAVLGSAIGAASFVAVLR